MTTIGQRVTERLRELNMSEYAVAKKLKMHYSNIQGLTSGRVKKPRYLGELAEALGITEKWLRTGEGSKFPSLQQQQLPFDHQSGILEPSGFRESKVNEPPQAPIDYTGVPMLLGQRNLAVYNVKMLNPKAQSFYIETEKPNDYIFRPPYLTHNNHAFAIYAQGSAMEPKFEPGDLLVIDPFRPPQPYDYVIIEQKNQQGQTQCFLRRYIRTVADEVILQQFTPWEEHRLRRDEIKSLMRIFSQNELLGG